MDALKRPDKVDGVADLPLQLAPPALNHGVVLSHKQQTTPDLPLKSKETLQAGGPSFPADGPSFQTAGPSFKTAGPSFQTDGSLVPHTSQKFTCKELGVDVRELEDDVKLPSSRTTPVEPEEHFVPGSVTYTTREAVQQMLVLVRTLGGNHGCNVDKNYLPEGGVYDRGVNYIVEKMLGQGANGRAELCHDRHSGELFVKKEIPKESLRHSEVLAPLTLNHGNITKFYGLIQREVTEELMGGLRMELLLEYGGTALSSYLRDRTLTEDQIWDLMGQGLSAFKALDDSGIVHFDVKPENLCVMWTGSKLTLKVTDFGSAKLPRDPVDFVGVTFEYMAPEGCKLALQSFGAEFSPMITQGDMTGKVDVFAFALVVMYMYKGYHILVKRMTGQDSYNNDEQRQALQLNLIGLLAIQEDLVQSLVPDECDPDMRELLLQMTQHNIRDRLSAEQALLVVRERELKMEQMVPIMPQQKRPIPTPAKVYEMPDFQRQAFNLTGNTHIPDNAVNQMDIETVPIKNTRKYKQRHMLQKPYIAGGKDGKWHGKHVASKTSTLQKPYFSAAGGKDEKWHGKHLASKTMKQTPVQEMETLTLTHGQESKPSVQKTEKIGNVVAQPPDDVDFHNTELAPSTVQPKSSVSAIINLDQWQKRVERTVDVPDLTCEQAEAMDCLQYDMKTGSYRPERLAAGQFQLAAALNDEPEIIFGNTDMRPVTVAGSSSAMEVGMEPEPAVTPRGNLPNFDLL